jgi:hypothetical protein
MEQPKYFFPSSKGFAGTKMLVWIVICVLVIVIAIAVYFLLNHGTSSQTKIPISTAPSNTYDMSQYIDSTYSFSFWYPSALQITSTITQDSASFPGGVAVETLQVGSTGGTSIIVVNSPTSTITDEPSNHASPIAQTEYFYDSPTKQWMVAYPQGASGPGSGATTTADISKTTMSGLIMLPSGKRFDTTIIPLNMTQFLVISDGGGSSFTNQLAETIVQKDASVDTSAQTTALQAEAAACASQ